MASHLLRHARGRTSGMFLVARLDCSLQSVSSADSFRRHSGTPSVPSANIPSVAGCGEVMFAESCIRLVRCRHSPTLVFANNGRFALLAPPQVIHNKLEGAALFLYRHFCHLPRRTVCRVVRFVTDSAPRTWKFGPYSIKSAFEIEHSTSIYSGILRLSDLRAEAPNSNYPLFIVASEDRRRRVFEELKRPTFSGPCLRLNEVIRFLGYAKIREIDEVSKNSKDFDVNVLLAAGESVPQAQPHRR